MKVLSYSLFGDPDSFEFPFYLRGVYFNARMARLLFPEWSFYLYIENNIYNTHAELIKELVVLFNIMCWFENPAPKCESMLTRMKPLYHFGVRKFICRDLDAILTYKDAQAVHEWDTSGLCAHGITDDPAHTIPIMGGMCGFYVDYFKKLLPQYDTFKKLIYGANLNDHGSDQNLLMKNIYPKVKGSMVGHFFKGCKENVKIVKNSVSNQIPGVDPKLWESNNTCRMIGSPGVVDFELLRFFNRFDNNPKYDEFEAKFKEICYWRR